VQSTVNCWSGATATDVNRTSAWEALARDLGCGRNQVGVVPRPRRSRSDNSGSPAPRVIFDWAAGSAGDAPANVGGDPHLGPLGEATNGFLGFMPGAEGPGDPTHSLRRPRYWSGSPRMVPIW